MYNKYNLLTEPFRPGKRSLIPEPKFSPNHGNSFLSFGVEAVVGGWIELDRTTLGSPADDITVSGLADKRYYMVLVDKQTTGASDANIRLGNGTADSGNNYAQRFSNNGAADSTGVSIAQIQADLGGRTTPAFTVGYLGNLSANEKLWLSDAVGQSTAGAGTAPERSENVGLHAQTANPNDVIQAHNINAGSFNTGAQVVVLEWDPADVHTTNFWETLASVNASGSSTNLSSGTIAAKKYLWIQCYLKNTTSHTSDMTFNNDTTTYAYRTSDNGAADSTSVSQNDIELFSATTTPIFVNMFILNISASEKLVNGSTANQNTAGAGTAPNIREFVGKWDETASQITEIDIDSSSGNWDSVSIINVYGAD